MTPKGIKRFYRDATVAAEAGLYRVLLDGRPVRTPAGAFLATGSPALAAAIAEEWRAQGETVQPTTMPLTALANTTIDRVGPRRDDIVADVARYAATDLLCYRAEAPAALVERQAAEWQPLLDWAAAHLDASFKVASGVVAVEQPAATLAAVAATVRALDVYRLAACARIASATGSIVLALAVLAGRIDAETAHRAAMLDELWQADRWGRDAEAEARRAAVAEDIGTAARFADLAGPGA